MENAQTLLRRACVFKREDANRQKRGGSGRRRSVEERELDGLDGGEGAAMGRAGAELREGLEVGGGAVALVGGKAVAGMAGVQFEHPAVARDLGEDAGGGDGQARRVALDDGVVGDGETADGEAVDEGQVDPAGDGRDGAGHRQVRRAEDVQAVDLLDRGLGDAVGDEGAPLRRGEACKEKLPPRGRELFRIVKALQGAIGFAFEPGAVEEDRGGDHRARQGAAAGFVDAGDTRSAGLPGLALVAEEEAHASFRRLCLEVRPRR